ncbi:MAG: glycosyltransferase [Flavobacteriales bacterium]|nr:glycosyltransferase [Flavobacteriales bacterium]
MPFSRWLALPHASMEIIDLHSLPIWQLTLAIVFIGSLLVQLFYYAFFFARLAFHRPTQSVGSNEPVSVIICAWNEEDNLKKNLQSVLEQDYPEFEVIVVNDHSLDETDLMLQSWQQKYPHLRVINLTRENVRIRGKKFAISMGIKGAKYEHLLFTDADCRPTSKHWLRYMTEGLKGEKKLVLGFGGFEKRSGLLNMFYRYESVHIAMQYMSYALAGLPYMGVGRNLAYQKELFFQTKGFIKHRHISSGDDDLLVNEVASGRNTTVETRKEAQTLSAAPESWAAWWLQKRRHLSTGSFYKLLSKIFLGIFTLSHVLFYLSFFGLLSMETLYWLALCGIFLKWTVHLSIIAAVTRILDARDLLLFSLLGDLFTPFFNTAVALSNRIKPPIRWR